MTARKRSDHFLVQGSILAAASLLVRVIGLLYRIPMVRIIGDEGMGYYSYAFELYNLALILSSYSLPLAVSKLVAARGINKEYKSSYRIFLSALIFAATVGLIATFIIFFGADFFANAISNNPNVALPLRVLAPTIFVFSIMGVFRGFYQGKKTMIPTAVSQVLEQIVNAVVSILASYLLMKNFSASVNVASYGAAGGTLGTFAGAFTGLLFLLFVFILYKPILNKQLRSDTSTNTESYPAIYKLLFITISPIILSQTVYQVSGLIDGSLFGHIMAGKEVSVFEQSLLHAKAGDLYSDEFRSTLIGVYSQKYRLLSNVPVAIAAAMASAIVTSITAAKAKGMDDVIRSKVHSSIKLNMMIAIPSAVGMGVLASPIMKLIFNDITELSANLLRLGSIAIVFFALSTVSSAVLQGINKMRIPVINSAISLGFHIILLFILLMFTPLSTYALVIGNVTFALVVCILNWFSIEKYLNYKQEIMNTFIIPTVSSGLMGIAAYFIYIGLHLLTGRNLISLVISVIISAFIYFILLIYMKGIDEAELAFLPKGGTIIRLLRRIHLL